MAFCAGVAHAAPGDLDQTYGGGGTRVDGFGTYPSPVGFAGNDLASANGRPLVAGSSDGDFAIVSPAIDGTLVPGFGALGAVFTDFGGTEGAEALWRINGGPDAGKFVAAGNTNAGGQNAAAVARYNSDGSPDTSFSGDGKLTFDLPAGDLVTDVAVSSAGRVAVSVDTPASDGNIKAVAFTAAGVLDTSFGPNDDGIATASTGPAVDDSARTLGFQSTGKLIVAGSQDQAAADADNFLIVRFGIDGMLDDNADADPPIDFAGDGIQAIDFASAGKDDGALALAIDSIDRIVVTGATAASGLTGGGTIRLHEDDGSLDNPGFGGGGAVFWIGAGFSSRATDVATGPSDQIAVYGFSSESQDFTGLQRLDSAGTQTFADVDTGDNTGTGGSFDYDLAMSDGVAFDPGGGMMIAGEATEQPTGGPGAFVQLWTPGTTPVPAAGYGGEGTAFVRPTRPQTAFGSAVSGAPAGAGAPSGSFLVGGSVQTGDSTIGLFVARHLASGAPDTSFGNGGVAVAPIGTPGQSVFPGGIAVQPDGKVVIAGGTFESGVYAAAAARFTTSGALDPAFDGPGGSGNGAFTFKFGGDDSGLRSLAVDSTSRIYVVGYRVDGGSLDPVVARMASSGALDPDFGAAGVYNPISPTPQAGAFGVAVQPDGKAVALVGASPSDLTVVRITDDPGLGNTALDSSFGGGDGEVPVPGIGVPNDGFDPLALDSAGRALVGGASSDHMAVARLTTAGVLDDAFSGDGIAQLDFGGIADAVTSARGLPGGGVVLAGRANTPDPDFALAQLTPSGQPETGFSGDGEVTTDFGPNSSGYGFGILSQSRATVVGIAGLARASARYELFVASNAVSPNPPNPPAPPQAKCKKKKKKKKSAAAAAKCKKKKKKKK